MTLYLLKRVDATGYDMFVSFVIRAPTAKCARQIAADHAGDEGKAVWLDSNTSKIEHIASTGEPGVVLGRFNAG